jgi:hypothetical protein
MEHLPLTPPGWTLEQELLVTLVVFVTWNVLAWVKSRVLK